MRFQSKLMLATGSVAVITLGVSLLGYWQASRLGSAVYEVGVVRLPSIEGLHTMMMAKAELDDSARALSRAVDAATIAAEMDRQARAWERAGRGRAVYEPLPQTVDEAATWTEFVPAWTAWKASYDAAMSRVTSGQAQGTEPGVTAVAGSAVVDALLIKLSAINDRVAAEAIQHSVASYQDLTRLRYVMLLAAVISALGAVAVGLVLGRRVSRPLMNAATSIARIADGDTVPPLPVWSHDEIGQIAAAVNHMVARQAATEAERGKATEALRKSEEKFSKMFLAAPVGIGVSDLATGRLDAVNRELVRLLGYSTAELIGRSSLELGLWADTNERDHIVATIRANGEVHDLEVGLRAKDGHVLTVRYSGELLQFDGQALLLSVFVDVTDRKRAEAAVRKSEEKFSKVFTSAPVGIAVSSLKHGALVEMNDEFLRLLGFRREEVIGRTTVELDIWPDPAVRESIVSQLLADNTISAVVQLRTKRGELVTVRGASHNIDIDGELFMVSAVVDLTEQRRAEAERAQFEEQFHQSQKMEAVGRLAGGVAHDFNNLLTAILGYCELLLENVDPIDARRADILEIQKAGKRAAGLTRQLLAFSRKQIIEPTRLDLNAIVANIRPMLGRLIGADVKIVPRLQPQLGTVKADLGQVEQVLLNLAVNARDAMPKGGTLTISTADVDLDEHHATTRFPVAPGPYVSLTVSDTGTGMPSEVQARLFEPFFTTKEVGKGTGLGLATVHGIVARAGGGVRVDSELGHGTSFHVYFPRLAAAGPEAEAPKVKLGPRAGGETVLVVDDAEWIRDLAARFLERQGYKVRVAANAEEARRVFEESDAHDPIDVLLTDVVMPGASGPELTRELIGQRPGLKVVYMSGYTEETIVQHGVLMPGIAFLNKPFTSDTLGLKLREALDGTTSARTLD